MNALVSCTCRGGYSECVGECPVPAEGVTVSALVSICARLCSHHTCNQGHSVKRFVSVCGCEETGMGVVGTIPCYIVLCMCACVCMCVCFCVCLCV